MSVRRSLGAKSAGRLASRMVWPSGVGCRRLGHGAAQLVAQHLVELLEQLRRIHLCVRCGWRGRGRSCRAGRGGPDLRLASLGEEGAEIRLASGSGRGLLPREVGAQKVVDRLRRRRGFLLREHRLEGIILAHDPGQFRQRVAGRGSGLCAGGLAQLPLKIVEIERESRLCRLGHVNHPCLRGTWPMGAFRAALRCQAPTHEALAASAHFFRTRNAKYAEAGSQDDLHRKNERKSGARGISVGLINEP